MYFPLRLLILLRSASILLIFLYKYFEGEYKEKQIYILVLLSLYSIFQIFEIMTIKKIWILKENMIKSMFLFTSPIVFELILLLNLNVLNGLGNLLIEAIMYIQYRDVTTNPLQQLVNILPLYYVTRIFIAMVLRVTFDSFVQIIIIIIVYLYDIFKYRCQQEYPASTASFQKVDISKNIEDKVIESQLRQSQTERLMQDEPMKEILPYPSNQCIVVSKSPRMGSVNSLRIPIKQQKSDEEQLAKIFTLSQYSTLNMNFYQHILNLFPYGCIILNSELEILYKNYHIVKIFDTSDENEIIIQVSKVIGDKNIQNITQHQNLSKDLKKPKSTYNQTNSFFVEQQQFEELKKDNEDIQLLENFKQNSHECTFPNIRYIQFLQILPRSQDFSSSWMKPSSAYKFRYTQHKNGHLINLKVKIYSINSQNSQNTPNNRQYSHQHSHEQTLTLIIVQNASEEKHYNKLQKKHQFQNSLVESFSHELRTPLNCSIQSMQAVLQGNIRQEYQVLLRAALGSNYLLLHQINDILDSAAIENENFRYNWIIFNFGEIISEIEQIYYESLAVKNLKMIPIINKQELYMPFKSDKARIMQILVNLINNAIKFTKQGGTIELQIKFEQQENNNHRIVRFCVKDNGVGIESILMKKIKRIIIQTEYGRSKSLQEDGRFLGLGLTICAKIALGLTNQIKSNLIIESSGKDQGTTASFFAEDQTSFNQTLLFSQRQTMGLKFQKSKLSTSNSNNLESKDIISEKDQNAYKISVPIMSMCFDKFLYMQEDLLKEKYKSLRHIQRPKDCQICPPVLIVDDVPFNHIALRAMLQTQFINTESSYDGVQALNMVKNRLSYHCKAYSLILMDIEMPNLDGFQSTQQIKEFLNQNSLNTFIYMCSAYDSQDNVETGLRAGMDGFIFKPVKFENLKRVLLKSKLL